MLFKNDVFLLAGARFRLLHADVAADKAWVICLDDHLAWPACWLYSDLEDLVRLSPTDATPYKYSDAQLKRCDQAWTRLEPLINQHGTSLFDPAFRKQALTTHANKIGCSPATLYKGLRRFWQRGQDKNALLPDYHLSGRPTPLTGGPNATTAITAGRGRKPKHSGGIYPLTTQDAQHFHRTIKSEYLPDQRKSVADVYASLVNKHYSFADGNGKLHVNPLGSRPTIRQFRRFLRKHYNIEVRIRSREGDSDFEKDHRKKLGSIMADCQGVGHYYEIDATIADIYLVSSEDVNKIIGKPTLYLIIDRKSRLIVGFYFGLENASWNGAMQAILSISEDKRELCARYGVPYNPDDWPAHQVFPSEFLADRGDMISHASSNITEGLHVTVTNLPGKRPDWKPLVECGFKLVHDSIRPIAPAYDPPSNATRRRGKHFEKDACLTMSDFGNLILNTIIAHNRREILNYDMSTKELLDGVRPAPIDLWNHGIVTRAGLLTKYEDSTVRFALLRKKQASVTEHGVEFDGCYYSFPEAIEHKWFETARKSRFKVTVSYDTRLADSIYVHPLDGKSKPYVATLTERSSKYRGMSFDEIAYYEALRELLRLEAEHSRLQNRVDLDNRTKPRMNAARQKLKNEKNKVSRSARRADIQEVREQERGLERKMLAKIEGGKRDDTPRQSPGSTPENPEIAQSANVSVLGGASTQKPLSLDERVAAARARLRA